MTEISDAILARAIRDRRMALDEIDRYRKGIWFESREALTAALADALDKEEKAVGFTVYEAWPSEVALVAHMLSEERK